MTRAPSASRERDRASAPAIGGGGDHAKHGGGGADDEENSAASGEASMQAPRPPHFVRSPLPAIAGRDAEALTARAPGHDRRNSVHRLWSGTPAPRQGSARNIRG